MGILIHIKNEMYVKEFLTKAASANLRIVYF